MCVYVCVCPSRMMAAEQAKLQNGHSYIHTRARRHAQCRPLPLVSLQTHVCTLSGRAGLGGSGASWSGELVQGTMK